MSKQILIVDDSTLVRQLVRISLEARPDLKVCGEAADGVEGVEKAKMLQPDLIVLDFSRPRMDGLQAAPLLRKASPFTPIILFTLFAEAIPAARARESGIALVVSKTGHLSVLADEVQRLLGVSSPDSAAGIHS